MIEPNSPEDREKISKRIPVVAPDALHVREWPATLGNGGASKTKSSWEQPVAVLGRILTHWALAVACLYLLVLIAVTCPLIVLARYPHMKMSAAAEIYLAWPYWVWVAVMFICQIALLVVPARALSRRPVTRRPLILPILVGGLMMGVLAIGAVFTFVEMLNLSRTNKVHFPELWQVLAVACIIWAAWAVVFYSLSCRHSVEDALAKQSCALLTGSILEVLVAIPTHIAARHRTECCAGFGSFIGLTLGTSVMLFAYGPAVFFLFLARSRQLRPRRRAAKTTTAERADDRNIN
jgi:hypothetical protein